MNKEEYLSELERLLKLNEINNKYTILREYQNKIISLEKEGETFSQIITILGTPSEIVKKMVKAQSFSDDSEKNVEEDIIEEEIIDVEFEDDDIEEEDIIEEDVVFEEERDKKNEYNQQFKDSFFESKIKNKNEYSSNNKQPYQRDRNNSVLYIVVIALIITLLFRGSFHWFDMFGFHFNIFTFIFQAIVTITIIWLVILIIRKK